MENRIEGVKSKESIESNFLSKIQSNNSTNQLVSKIILNEDILWLSNMLFPELKLTKADIEKQYPPRINNPIITRFAPSPTGFLHIGGLYNALISEYFSNQNNGKFILRIEDTDKKRQTDNGIELINQGLNDFGLEIDEGPNTEYQNYGPYIQSQRELIYYVYAKELIERGLAYPCFLTEQELQNIRTIQQQEHLIPGIYGKYSYWRNASKEEVEEAINEGKTYVLRFKSDGKENDRVSFFDEIRGDIEINDNFNDIVLLKKDNTPTYHFAHVIDDYLMKTTHVIRGEEWISSTPLHLQLFKSLGLNPPKYAHIAPLLKEDSGVRRKLSKRKDPEADVRNLFKKGFPMIAIKSYLLNIANSGYLEANKEIFELSFESMQKSGALFDIIKLESISQEYISGLDNNVFFEKVLEWTKTYENDYYNLIIKYTNLSKDSLCIGRGTDNDPKNFKTFSDITEYLKTFIPELFQDKLFPIEEMNSNLINSTKIVLDDFLTILPEFLNREKDRLEFLKLNYNEKFSCFQDNNGKNLIKFKDYTLIIRLAISHSKNSPNLYQMIKVLGITEIEDRIKLILLEYFNK